MPLAFAPFLSKRRPPALTPIAPCDWLAPGPDRAHQMRQKQRLLSERPDDVLAALPGSEPAQQELLALLEAETG